MVRWICKWEEIGRVPPGANGARARAMGRPRTKKEGPVPLQTQEKQDVRPTAEDAASPAGLAPRPGGAAKVGVEKKRQLAAEAWILTGKSASSKPSSRVSTLLHAHAHLSTYC